MMKVSRGVLHLLYEEEEFVLRPLKKELVERWMFDE